MSAAHLDEQENPTWGNKTSYKNPVFQKRHYEFIADIFNNINKNDVVWHITEDSFLLVVEKFANKFTEISPKNNDGKPLFDKEKFLERVKNAKV